MKLDNYEKYETDSDKLFYAIICRRWEKTCEIIEKLSEKNDPKEILGLCFRDSGFTVRDCFSKNMQLLKSNRLKRFYDRLAAIFNEDFVQIAVRQNINYDNRDFDNGKTIFDIFFEGNQPVLDVIYFEKQTLPARQLEKNHASLVLDEVGTGKTVSGIYAMQNVIQKRISDQPPNTIFPSAAILIVCPYSKRDDWHNDILRQLGRESYIIEQGENGELIKRKSINPSKPLIYITGCLGGNNDGPHSALKSSLKTFHPKRRWDLVIIDECHNCFGNYSGIKADNIIMLTATPIKVKGNNVRNFEDYNRLMNSILGVTNLYYNKINPKKIDPIRIKSPTEHDIFVCHYKEDIFNVEINRMITFFECERTVKRQEWFWRLREERDFFTAMFADQDDFILSKKMSSTFKDRLDYHVEKNHKLEKLAEIITAPENVHKSYIVFCELTDTVDMIYNRLASLSDANMMIGKKTGKSAEIKNVTSNREIVTERIKTHIQGGEGKRAVFIVTGKSCGTGLNFGKFDGVIHYELPYTNTELEQRFGRIERADDLIENSNLGGKARVIENEMIFLVNKAARGTEESDFITNRMLHYAITKINVACKYMPLRNTVLLHPVFIGKVIADAKRYFEKTLAFLDGEEGERLFNEFDSYRKDESEVIGIIKEASGILSARDKRKLDNCNSINQKVMKLLSDVEENDCIKRNKKQLKDFVKADYTEATRMENFLDQFFEYYLWLIKTLKILGKNVGSEADDIDFEKDGALDSDDLGEAEADVNDDSYYEDSKVEGDNKKSSEKLFLTIQNKKQVIKDRSSLFALIKDMSVALNGDFCRLNTAGIFYVDNGAFYNQSVKDFREEEKNVEKK